MKAKRMTAAKFRQIVKKLGGAKKASDTLATHISTIYRWMKNGPPIIDYSKSKDQM